MAGELKLSFIVEAVDRATAVVRNITQAVARPGRAIAAMAGGATSALDRLSSSYAGMAGAIGGGVALKGIADEDAFIRRMAAVTGTPLKTMEALNRSMLDAAQSSRVAHSEILAAFDAYRQGGGDINAFGNNLKALSATIGVLGGHGEEAGAILATLRRSFEITEPKALNDALATTVAQLGNVRGGIESYAQFLPSLAESYAVLGHRGTEAMRELNAAYFMIAQNARSPRAAYGAMQEVMELIATPQARMRFTGVTGIAAEANGQVRPITDLIQDLAKFSGSKIGDWQLGEMLSPRALDALKGFRAEFDKMGHSPTLDKLLATRANLPDLLKQDAAATAGFDGALVKLQNTVKHYAVTDLTGPLDFLGAALTFAGGALARFLEIFGILATLGGAVAIIKAAGNALMLWQAIGAIAGMIGDFSIALRAGYGAVAAFNLVLAANPIGIWLTAIGLVIFAAYEIYEHWNWLEEKLGDIWDGITAIFQAAWDRIRPIIEPIVKAMEFLHRMPSAPAAGGIVEPVSGNFISIPSGTTEAGPRAALGGDQAQTKVGGEVTITFENPPPGMKTKKVTKTNEDFDLNVNMGLGLGLFGGGL